MSHINLSSNIFHNKKVLCKIKNTKQKKMMHKSYNNAKIGLCKSCMEKTILWPSGLTLAIILLLFETSCSRSTSAAAPSSSSQNSTSFSDTGCSISTDPSCLRCNHDGCIKCTRFLQIDDRRCVDSCPADYQQQWSTDPNLIGRICRPLSTSGSYLATLAGVAAGFLLCISLVALAIYIVRKKQRRKTVREKLINDTIIDRSDFLRQLEEMRPNAEHFLAMLNETRRQIRKLHLSGETATANGYRPVVRDLAKILILLNRPIELIPAAPHDWNHLSSWAEQALERYRPQVGQLIDFFQTPSDSRIDTALMLHPHSTFTSLTTTNSGGSNTLNRKSQQSSQNQLQIFGSLISLHEFEEPRSSDPFSSSFNTVKGNTLSATADLHASSLWLEDEFFKLGFRPQDEITTEL